MDIDERDALLRDRRGVAKKRQARHISRGNPDIDADDIDVEPVTLSLEALERLLSSSGLDQGEARTYKTQIDGLKSAAALRKEMNKLLSRAEAREAMAKIAHSLSAFVKRLEIEIPAVCYGLSMPESKAAVKTRVREIQTLFAAGCDEFWQEHPEI